MTGAYRVVIAEKNLNYKTALIPLQLTSKEHELNLG